MAEAGINVKIPTNQRLWADGAGEVGQFGYSSRNWLGLVLHIFLSELSLRRGEPVGGGEGEAAGGAAGPRSVPAVTELRSTGPWRLCLCRNVFA